MDGCSIPLFFPLLFPGIARACLRFVESPGMPRGDSNLPGKTLDKRFLMA